MNIQALGGAVCILLTSGAWAAPDVSFQPSCSVEGQQVVLTSMQHPGSGPTFSVALSTELQDERVLKIVYLATPMFYPGGPPQRTDVALPTLAAGDYVITTFYRIDHGGGMLTPETFAGMIELRVRATQASPRTWRVSTPQGATLSAAIGSPLPGGLSVRKAGRPLPAPASARDMAHPASAANAGKSTYTDENQGAAKGTDTTKAADALKTAPAAASAEMAKSGAVAADYPAESRFGGAASGAVLVAALASGAAPASAGSAAAGVASTPSAGAWLAPGAGAGSAHGAGAVAASGGAAAAATASDAGAASTPRSSRHEVQAYGPGELRHHPLGRDLRRSVAFLEEAMMRSPRREPG